MMTNEIRIATVKANGRRYIVQQIDFRAEKVHTWGEVASFRNGRSRHDGTKCFKLDAVEITTEIKSFGLLSDLFDQMVETRRDAGHRIRRTRGGNAIDEGYSDSYKKARAESKRLAEARAAGFDTVAELDEWNALLAAENTAS